ncbi:MAG: hypothetical protein ABIR83_12125 [Nakamurella sp.]
MKIQSTISRNAATGAASGIAGGAVFGAAMASLGTLPTVASIVRTDSVAVGFVVHMAIAAVIGAGFGMLVSGQRTQVSETLFWGLIYGAFWWFLGALTLLPLLVGRPVAWDLPSASALLPSLIGHLYYGATTALVFVAFRREGGRTHRARLEPAGRGVVAGSAVAWVLYVTVDKMAGVPLGWILLTGALAGLGYPLLFTARPEGVGPSLIRGTAYGFMCWVVAVLTLPPLLAGGVLDWSPAAAVSAVDRLPLYLLLGAGIGLVFTALGGLSRWLFVDDVRMLRTESLGTRGIRATAYGALAGLAGGLLFTVVMVLVNELPTVAGLIGARAPAAGLVVHLVIAQIIGVSYALLFRRRSFDLASGVGWGVSYGFLWWVLGGLTLLPIFGGQAPSWNAAGLAAAFPSLVGHLAYGAALGAVFYRLEARTDPWWFTRSQLEAERVTARREQALGSAPALWGLIVLIALIMPVFLSNTPIDQVSGSVQSRGVDSGGAARRQPNSPMSALQRCGAFEGVSGQICGLVY